MEHQQNEPKPLELSPQIITIMTTEHYNLQTGRSMTIGEANGRSSLFVGAVSSGLVALALVGQISHLDFKSEFIREDHCYSTIDSHAYCSAGLPWSRCAGPTHLC